MPVCMRGWMGGWVFVCAVAVDNDFFKVILRSVGKRLPSAEGVNFREPSGGGYWC